LVRPLRAGVQAVGLEDLLFCLPPLRGRRCGGARPVAAAAPAPTLPCRCSGRRRLRLCGLWRPSLLRLLPLKGLLPGCWDDDAVNSWLERQRAADVPEGCPC
jgi:hypothetical protein